MVYDIPKKSLIICAFFGNLASGVTLTADNRTDLSDFDGFFFEIILGVPRRRGESSSFVAVLLLRFVNFFVDDRTMVLSC